MLHAALEADSMYIASLGLARGARVEDVSSEGEGDVPPLLYSATLAGKVEWVAMCLERGVDVNARWQGMSPVMACVSLSQSATTTPTTRDAEAVKMCLQLLLAAPGLDLTGEPRGAESVLSYVQRVVPASDVLRVMVEKEVGGCF